MTPISMPCLLTGWLVQIEKVTMSTTQTDQAVPSYVQWEEKVAELLADHLAISAGDANGLVEAQSFCMQQSWGQGLGAQETVDKIIAQACPAG